MAEMKDTDSAPLSQSSSDDKAHTDLESSDSTYAFLVHSQDSLGQNSPPEIDNQRLARQKRRRTSPEDHAILEAEYDRNSKPDKASRMEIVKRVALGEKEVQIWFQNRRQMTRRKFKPTVQHEILPGVDSSQGSATETVTSSSQPQPFSSQSSMNGSQPVAENAGDKAARLELGVGLAEKSEESADGVTDPIDSLSRAKVASDFTRTADDLIRSLTQLSPSKSQPGYLANRRSALFAVHDDRTLVEGPPTLQSDRLVSNQPSKTMQPLQRASSLVKLSLSLEGKAEVTTRTGTTPSPPRPQSVVSGRRAPRAMHGLQRSHSAIESAQALNVNAFPIPFPRRSMMGRSRDARTWEFYCDSDARNALTEQAEREEKGSATAAIGLIRSQSNKSRNINPNTNKRNAHSRKPETAKRLKADISQNRKPGLERAVSSVARLQTTTDKSSKAVQLAGKPRKSNSQSALCGDGDGDSDKENWVPGTQAPHPRRRRSGISHAASRILEEVPHAPSHSSRNGASLSQMNSSNAQESSELAGSAGLENDSFEIDDEVAAFMGESTPREEEDLDCVQNLLSLSQAAWQ